MTTSQIETKVRNDLSQQNPQGRFSPTFILDKLNEVFADRVIPDLYSIGGFNFLQSLIITGELDLSESAKNEDWDEADLSSWVDGESDAYVFYPTNPFAMVDGDDYRIPVTWVPFLSGYFTNYNLGYHKSRVLGTRLGNTVVIYDDDYSTLYVQAVQIKEYESGDTVDLDDYLIKKTIIPAICSECMIKDKGINMMNIFDMKYGKNLRRLERDVVRSFSPTKIVPQTRRNTYYGLKGG